MITASLKGKSCADSVRGWLAKVEPMIVLAESDPKLRTDIKNLAAQRTADPAAWRTLFQGSVRMQVGTPEAPVLPIEIWLLIGGICFRDPFVHEDLAHRISALMRTSILGWTLDAPAVKTSPLTLWLMLAITLDRMSEITGKSPKIERILKHSLRTLSNPGWAGFWDQWLLAKYESTLAPVASGTPEIDAALKQLAIHHPQRHSNSKAHANICARGVKFPNWLDQIMPRTKQA